MPRLRPDRFYALDAMRGLAAFAVGAYHCDHIGIPLMPAGYLAVDFFFALSGLVIGWAYEPRLRNGLTPRRFAAMRMIRLYPLYLIGSTIGLIALVIGTPLTPYGDYSTGGAVQAIIPAALMLPNPFTILLYPANTPAWSLFFELLVNLAFGVVLVRMASKWLAMLAAVALGLFYWQVRIEANTNLGTILPHFWGGAARVAVSFTIGLLVARTLALRERRASWAILLPAALLLVVLAIEPSRRTDMLVIALLFPAVLVVASRVEIPPIAWRLCGHLGDVSYPFYAIHFGVLSLWGALSLKAGWPAWATVGGFLIVSWALAWALMPLDKVMRARLTTLTISRRSVSPG